MPSPPVFQNAGLTSAPLSDIQIPDKVVDQTLSREVCQRESLERYDTGGTFHDGGEGDTGGSGFGGLRVSSGSSGEHPVMGLGEPPPHDPPPEEPPPMGVPHRPLQATAGDAPSPVVTLPGVDSKAVPFVPSEGGAGSAMGGCFRLRKVTVHELLQDNTLGLLLHGTSVVGFCSQSAEGAGWCVGDQIVEVDGMRVASFDNFLGRFLTAQERGLPINFSVLRRESLDASGDSPGAAESQIDNFFAAADFADLAGYLARTRPARSGKAEQRDGYYDQDEEDEDSERCLSRGETSITDNPYIQALRKRREELLKTNDAWTDENTPLSLAARLATRQDGIPRMTGGAPPDIGDDELHCHSWPFSCTGNGAGGRTCVAREAKCDIQPTPRVDLIDVLEPQKSWPNIEPHSALDAPKEKAQPNPCFRGDDPKSCDVPSDVAVNSGRSGDLQLRNSSWSVVS